MAKIKKIDFSICEIFREWFKDNKHRFNEKCRIRYYKSGEYKHVEIDFENVPICIEANTVANLEKLQELGGLLSKQVVTIDSTKRRQLHLAAVFVCNFVNHFYTIGEKLLQEAQLDFDLLKPIILETANKAMQFSPLNVQTGPAIRDDIHIMEQHLKMLVQHPEWHKLYELVSEDIRTNRRGDPLKN